MSKLELPGNLISLNIHKPLVFMVEQNFGRYKLSQNHQRQKNKAEPEVLIWKSNSFEKIAYDIKSEVMSRYQTYTSSYMGVNCWKMPERKLLDTYMVHVKICWTKSAGVLMSYSDPFFNIYKMK